PGRLDSQFPQLGRSRHALHRPLGRIPTREPASSRLDKGRGSNMGQFSGEKPASPGSGTQATNPRRLQPELNFPTLVSRYFDNEMEQKAGKFMLINPPDAVIPA